MIPIILNSTCVVYSTFLYLSWSNVCTEKIQVFESSIDQ